MSDILRQRARQKLQDSIRYWYGGGEGMAVQDIATMLGVSRQTVYRNLDRMGIRQIQKGVFGAPSKDECVNGHDLNEWSYPTKVGRRCLVCKRDSDRESQRRRYAKRKNQLETSEGN